jgi:hypothetical protein
LKNRGVHARFSASCAAYSVRGTARLSSVAQKQTAQQQSSSGYRCVCIVHVWQEHKLQAAWTCTIADYQSCCLSGYYYIW